MKTANADRVKWCARITPTRSGGRAPRSTAETLRMVLEWSIERTLNIYIPPDTTIFHQPRKRRKTSTLPGKISLNK